MKKYNKFFKRILIFVCLLLTFGSVYSQTVLFSEDFETDNWTYNGNFFLGISSTVTAYSGSNVLGCEQSGDYANKLTEDINYAFNANNIDCNDYDIVKLSFFSFSEYENGYDYGYVYVSNDGGVSYTLVETFSDTEFDWTQHSINISSIAANSSQVHVKFTMSSDNSVKRDGWNIDNVEITGIKTPNGYGDNPGLVYWLRGDLGVTGTNPVSRWADQSGNGNDATPGNGPAQITSADMNSQKVMEFNGINDALGIAGNYRINTDNSGGGTYSGSERSMFVAFRTGGDVNTTQYIYEQGGGTNGLGIFVKNGNVYVTVYNGGNANRVTNSYPISTETEYILSFIWDNGTLTAKLNNKDFYSQTSSGTINSIAEHTGDISIAYTDGTTRDESGASVTAGQYFLGQIAELIYYDKALTEVEELEINNDLADRYGINVSLEKDIYYSYQSGNWNSINTWTHDPGGTTQTATDVPNSGDWVVVLKNRTVTLSEDVDTTNLDLTIREHGTLDQGVYSFSAGLKALKGSGLHVLASNQYPVVLAANNEFVMENGGTTEYNNVASFTLSDAQDTYNNLTINTTGVTTQLSDLTLNGDLHVQNGTYRINDNISTIKLNLEIKGDVIVDVTGAIGIGQGSTNSTTSPNGIVTSASPVFPYINYYEQFHRVVIEGDFTNSGIVKFTNLTYPIFNLLPPINSGTTSGAASVYFRGATNNILTCNNTTDFYNLVLDKGLDKTYKLTVYSTAYDHFRLFGANSSGGDLVGTDGANPNLKKALWIRTGTLELKGLTVIPSLSEGGGGGTPNSDFYIPENGALVLNSPEVIVLSTADDYQEVNIAYSVFGGSGSVNGVNVATSASSFSILGKLQVDDGYFSTRESGGIITWSDASGRLEINGGVVDVKQFRSESGGAGLASFLQTGGEFVLRGRFTRTPAAYTNISNLKDFSTATLGTSRKQSGTDGSFGTFNLDNTNNVFGMSGGVMRIYDNCGDLGTDNTKTFEVLSSQTNIDVSGGTLEIIPTDGDNTDPSRYDIKSTAGFANLIIRNEFSTPVAPIRLNTYGITIFDNLTISKGVFNANNLNVTVGGDMFVENGASYTPGNNWTIFNGSEDQNLSVNTVAAFALKKLKVDKPAGSTLTIAGSQSVISIEDSLMILKATLNDGGKTINFAGTIATSSYLYNSGIHEGSGKIVMNDNVSQLITGDGSGVFQNLELNNNTGTAPVSLGANTTINGELTFSRDKLFNIGTYNLKFGASASVVTATTTRYIQTAGNAGDGGVSMVYNSNADRTFHLGSGYYTPATIGFSSAPDSYGTITVIPVAYEHTVTSTDNQALDYYWRVKSEGITNFNGKVRHTFTYNAALVSGTESLYLPAYYDYSNNTWNIGAIADVNEGSHVINDWNSPTQSANFLDGDYTAGESSAFGNPTVYYSRQDGVWNNGNTWSLIGHTGGTAGSFPGASDVVIIGGQDSVYLATNLNTANTGKVSCASLQIAKGAALDIGYNPESNFGIVKSTTGGNGNFRVTTRYNSPYTFEFPLGDFSDFNQNLGTTELYTTNNTAGTTYWLPNNIDTYGNLIISPIGGSNIIFGNTDVIIYGDLITKGQDSRSWFCPNWGTSNYPTAPITPISKTITVNGDFELQGGALIWYNRNNTGVQNFVIGGDLIIDTDAGIKVYNNGNNNTQSVTVSGSLINNSLSPNNTQVWLPDEGWESINQYRGCDFTEIPLIFNGAGTEYITNDDPSDNTYTIIESLTINKGSSQADSLVVDITGAFNTPADNWLTLKNGTFKYLHDDDLTITTTSQFIIPSTSGLFINSPGNSVYLANALSNDNDVYLNGKLTIVDGDVVIGNSANDRNNDIEYSGGGNSEIDMQGGSLTVNGQIRRNPSTTAGILKYHQSDGDVTINGRNVLTANAKLEILNAGSAFNMSDGTLTIVRGGGDDTYGDLYIRPGSSTVTGGTIIFNPDASGNNQDYIFDANVPIHHLTIESSGGDNANVKLMVSPLTINGNLTIDQSSCTLDVNSTFDIPITIKGNFHNDGNYLFHKNKTTFKGKEQIITGNSDVEFYDLDVAPEISLTLNKDATVNNDLVLVLHSGNLKCGSNSMFVKGNVTNNASYEGTNGLVLNGSKLQYLGGTGRWGQLELNNKEGARLLNAITLDNDFILTNGILDINRYLFTLGDHSDIVGSGFSNTKMIASDGVYSNVGINKVFKDTDDGKVFVFPLGTSGKYTPAVLTLDAIGHTGTFRINNINDRHPATLSPYNVLNYFWEIESDAISGFKGNIVFNYLDEDATAGTEANYIDARLLVPDPDWSKGNTTNVDETANTITFNYLEGTNNLSGEYTAGEDASIPDIVPEYETTGAGTDWNDPANWTPSNGSTYPCPAGGPNGFIVHINHEIHANTNHCLAYKTYINSKLVIDAAYSGHNLGTVFGNGTLYLESGTFPEGRFSDFLDCANNSTLEYGGSGTYNIIADLYHTVPNLTFSGTGERRLPATDLTICKKLEINGPVLNNYYNKKLTIQGTMERYGTGAFTSGSGVGATVSFAGDAAQTVAGTLGDFKGTNAFYNLEIDNSLGLTINDPGVVEVKGNLLLTNGLIHTSASSTLTIINTSENSITPAGGTNTSYVDGPLSKMINATDAFDFPVGKGDVAGNKIKLTSTASGPQLWTVEFFTPNATANAMLAPLTYVNGDEYWTVSSIAGSMAKINIDWDAASDLTPLMTANGLSDMRVAEYNTGTSQWSLLSSITSGSINTGTVSTVNRVELTTGSADFTSSCINAVKPRAQMLAADVCGNSGIPVSFTYSAAIPFNYTIEYTVNDVTPASSITFTALDIPPYMIPTPIHGVYKLTKFVYDVGNTNSLGVIDPSEVNVYENPTPSDIGSDGGLDDDNISLCGASSVSVLPGNNPSIGTGLWTIISGTGGSFDNPTVYNTKFNGTSGSTYVLEWTISNGSCESSDRITISFPFNAKQPSDFVAFDASVCQGETGVVYSVTNDPSVTYNWSYDGSNVVINGITNSVTLDFANNATSGTLAVTATNDCNTSSAREFYITVNPIPTITISADPIEICFGETSALKATGGGTYLWSPSGDLNFDNIQNPVFDPSITGSNPTSPTQVTATFTVTVTNGECSDTKTVDVVVNRRPETGPQYHISNDFGK